jgi:glycogen debranching enzyme
MHRLIPSSLLLCFVLRGQLLLAQQPQDSIPAMGGISNQGKNGSDPYVAAGDRAYLIGNQDGNFPDLGGHVPGEMGGLWIHPIKLIDGFWATLQESDVGKEVKLSQAVELINYPYGNRLRYGEVLDGLQVDRFQFSPDGEPGVVVAYTVHNATGRKRQLSLQLAVKTDLLPVWGSEEIGITDAPDTLRWDSTNSRFVARDTRHSWYAVWGAEPKVGGVGVLDPPPVQTRGMGVTAASAHRLSVAPHDSTTLTFVFAGSPTSRKAAERTFAVIAAQGASLLANKRSHYAAVLQRARIRIPDQRLQQVYDWVKVNAEWLVRDVPGVGRGLGGGLMEYPWWFGTETYSHQSLLASGRADLVEQSLRLLRYRSRKANGNGRIPHEITTFGTVTNPGNTQETAQFILTVGRVVRWTGDLSFAREMYPAMTQGLHWLLNNRDENHNLFPEGYGITEILGLNAEVIDVAVYTQQALLETAEVASLLGEKEAAAHYQRLGSQLERRINSRFWEPEDTSYADFFGTRAQAVSTAEGAMKQIRLAGEDKLTARDREQIAYYQKLRDRFASMPDTSRGWITNKNWPVITPLEVGIAPTGRAIPILARLRREGVGDSGVYLSAVDRQASMTISTGVAAVSEANYGRSDESLWYMHKIVDTFNRRLPGSMSEMMPDYGCFVIAWSMYGIVIPIVEHIFGVQPDAVHKKVVLEPQLPTGWEDLSIEDLPVGTNRISFWRRRTERGVEYTIRSQQTGWRFLLKDKSRPGAKYYLNGRTVGAEPSGIPMSGTRNTLLVTAH